MEHPVAHASVGELLWPTLNFLLFLAMLARYVLPQVRSFFANRTTMLRAQLAAGTEARAQAGALRAEIERDIADLPAHRARLAAEMRAAAERECRRLLEVGTEVAARLRNDGRLAAEQEFGAARDTLRAEVAAEAARQAGEIIRHALRPEDHSRFIDEFVRSAGGAA